MYSNFKPNFLFILIVLSAFYLSCNNHNDIENLGHRFVVEGDFDGDGKKEKIVEHYYSKLTEKELNKHYPHIHEYDLLVEHIITQKPYLFLKSDNPNIDSFFITDEPQVAGILYLKNEGDLNGDGSDELSFVIDWADFSAVNTCQIITYRNNKWELLYSFDIWDWLIAPYAKIDAKDTATLKELQVEYKDFKGLIKPIEKNLIEVIYMNEDAEKDTMQVSIK